MLSELDAFTIALTQFPHAEISKPVHYKNVYLMQIFDGDPDEGFFDPYYSVNDQTGEFRDFSIITDGDTTEITKLFLEGDD